MRRVSSSCIGRLLAASGSVMTSSIAAKSLCDASCNFFKVGSLRMNSLAWGHSNREFEQVRDKPEHRQTFAEILKNARFPNSHAGESGSASGSKGAATLTIALGGFQSTISVFFVSRLWKAWNTSHFARTESREKEELQT